MTLTETAAATKRGFRLTLIFGSIFLVIWIISLYIYNNVYVPYQKNQVKAEQKFGPVQKPKFPKSLTSSAAFEYSLDTASGTLPANFPRLTNVYFIPPQQASLLAPDRASKLANSLNFNSAAQIISPGVYQYSDQWGGQLTVELSTGNFTFKRGNVPAPLDPSRPLGQVPFLGPESSLISNLSDYLLGRNLLLPNFKKPRGAVLYDNPDRQLATTAQVSLWPNNIGDIPVVSDSPIIGPISAKVTKYIDENFKYASMNYSVWSFDPKSFSTYGTNPIATVFGALKSGQGVVIKNTTRDNKASITKIYLAYYLSSQYQPYLEPIYVFEGDNFIAYLPALTDESYAK